MVCDILDVSATRKSYQGWYPTIRKHRSKQRQIRREDQKILFIDDTYLDYRKNRFGSYIMPKHLWNEGFDFANNNRNAPGNAKDPGQKN